MNALLVRYNNDKDMEFNTNNLLRLLKSEREGWGCSGYWFEFKGGEIQFKKLCPSVRWHAERMMDLARQRNHPVCVFPLQGMIACEVVDSEMVIDGKVDVKTFEDFFPDARPQTVAVWGGRRLRPVAYLTRTGDSVTLTCKDGEMVTILAATPVEFYAGESRGTFGIEISGKVHTVCSELDVVDWGGKAKVLVATATKPETLAQIHAAISSTYSPGGEVCGINVQPSPAGEGHVIGYRIRVRDREGNVLRESSRLCFLSDKGNLQHLLVVS